MLPRLKADKDKAVVLGFFREKRAQAQQLLDTPPPTTEAEGQAFFYTIQDLYSLAFKAIHRAFNNPEALIDRLNQPVVWKDGRRDYSHRERLADHIQAIDEVIRALGG